MTILNLMLGRKRGGLEQAALDYAEALALARVPSLTVISPQAWIEAPLVAAGMPHQSLANFGYWDIFAAHRLGQLAKKTRASAIICHGNRALGIALRGLKGTVPIIPVAHGYSTDRFIHADRAFAITEDIARHLAAVGVKTITAMPNMVRLPALAPRPPRRQPPVIGAMGRLVGKKGFDVYLDALAILKSRGIPFCAILGGDGKETPSLAARIAQHGLEQHVTLLGWVKDKAAFFESIDLFVLPSRHEPFGIVLIEAMAHGVPVVTTDAEGPAEIATDNVTARIVPRDQPAAMADALAALLADPARATAMGEAGRTLAATEYSMERMATRLRDALMPHQAAHG